MTEPQGVFLFQTEKLTRGCHPFPNLIIRFTIYTSLIMQSYPNSASYPKAKGNGRGKAIPTADSAAARNWTEFVAEPELKNDRYRKARGGRAAFMTLFCSKCATPLLLYQKDGNGALQRCYLNRIFAPSQLEALHRDLSIKEPKHLVPLICDHCKTVIGCPMRHNDGRLAFRLQRGAFIKKWGLKRSL